jgi:hypothetical protein
VLDRFHAKWNYQRVSIGNINVMMVIAVDRLEATDVDVAELAPYEFLFTSTDEFFERTFTEAKTGCPNQVALKQFWSWRPLPGQVLRLTVRVAQIS